jgi:hypothetical protein
VHNRIPPPETKIKLKIRISRPKAQRERTSMNLERSGDHMPRSAPPQSIERAEKNLHNPLPPPRARKPYYVTCKPLRSQSDEIVASHMSTSTRGRPGWETGLARKAVAENLVQSGYGGTDGRTGEDDCGTATANPRLAIHCHSLP